MTIVSIGNCATSTSLVAATPNNPQILTGTVSGNVAAGQFVVAVLAADNLGTVDGETNEHLKLAIGPMSLSKVYEYSNAGGGVAQGATCSIWVGTATSQIGSGSSVAPTFSGPTQYKALTAWKFSMAPGNAIDLDKLPVARIDKNADPGALTISNHAYRQHLFIRGTALEINVNTHTPGGSMTAINGATTGGGVADTAMTALGAFQIGYHASLNTDPSASVCDSASIALALYERFSVHDRPGNVSLIDNFNRANGLLVADYVWSGNQVRRTGVTALGITSNQLGGQSGEALTALQFGPDLDIYIDVTASINEFAFYYSIANGGTASATGYKANYRLGTPGWSLWSFSGLTDTSFANTPDSGYELYPQVGDKIRVTKRDDKHALYLWRATLNRWEKMVEGTHSTYWNRVGPVGLEVVGTGGRFDNFSGGTVALTGISPVNETLIDHFNRANGALVAAPWNGLGVRIAGPNTSVAIASNNVSSTGPADADVGTIASYGPDLDLMLDCVTPLPGTGGSDYIGIYFCMADVNTVNSSGYMLSIDNRPRWQIYRYTPLATGLTPTSSVAAPAAGDTVWIARRSSSIKVYVRRSGSANWTLVLDLTDSTYVRSGRSGLWFYRTGASSAWDNFRGGTVNLYTPPKSMVMI